MGSWCRPFVLLVSLVMGLVLGCSQLPPEPEPPAGPFVACTNSVDDAMAFLNWELIVHPDSIASGEPFTATLGGNAVFDEDFLDAAQDTFPAGVEEVNLVEAKATVRVRSGATGDDVVLKPEPIAYECLLGRDPCDPANDLEGDAGLRGNTDCEPEGDFNPCGRFVSLPTSFDCAREGVCATRRKHAQCDRNGFCITGDLLVRLQETTGTYTAATDKTEVLFGWDDDGTGATRQEGGDNHGTWILPEAAYEEPPGSNGIRVTAISREAPGSLPVGLECTMGVPSRGPPCNSVDFLSCPTPDSELVSFPIQMEAF